MRKLPIDNTIKQHPLWCSGPYGNNDYTGHFNIEAVWEGTGEALPVYLNAHIDTVQSAAEELLNTRWEGDVLHGLGACDDKGSVASIYTVLSMLSGANIRLPFDVVGHVVVEEEIGGNGALAATDRPLSGQAAIVLEPTNGAIKPIHRCGLWARVTCRGTAAHTASMAAGKGVSAFHLVVRAGEILQEVYNAYIEEYKKAPLPYYGDYIPQLNIGMVKTGDWPAKVPDRAEMLVSVPVLPNWTNAMMRQKIEEALSADEMLKDRVSVEYVFDRGSSVLPMDHPLVKEVVASAKAYGLSGDVEPHRALSDKYFYQEVLGLPTVTFGPGNNLYAHSDNEQIKLDDVLLTR